MKQAILKTNLGEITIELFEDIAPKTVENFILLANGEKEWIDPKTNKTTKKRFYDGLTFHRIIPDFMIQGGCPIGNGTGGPGYSFEDECYDNKEKVSGKIENESTAVELFNSILVPYLQSTSQPDSEILEIANKCVEAQNGKLLMEKEIEYYLDKTGTSEFLANGKLKASVDYGTICMANSGPNTNGSQFFIVTKKDNCEWLNGKHTVFGKVIEGMDVVHNLEILERDSSDKPLAKNPAVIEEIKIENK